MLQITDDLSIYVTRGDAVTFTVAAENNGINYVFEPGETVRLKVFNKKDCGSIVLQKDFEVTEETERVELTLTEQETRIGGVISKPVDYWYEVELDPDTAPQTIIGYDDDGPKIFRLFPEGKDLEDEAAEEE